MNLVEKINKFGYVDKRGLQDIPDQKRIGVKMPWDIKALRIPKNGLHQIVNARWYGWLRFAYFLAISAIFHFPLKAMLSDEYKYTIPIAMCVVYFVLFCVEWKWGVRESNRIRYNKQKKLQTYPEGEYSYSMYLNLHLRDLLVLAIIPVGDYLINGMFI